MYKFDELMAREMTRKQFLVTLGAGIVGLLGFSTLMGIFSHNSNAGNNAVGYGMRDYGP